MVPLLHRQPWKWLYVTYLLTKVFLVKLPFWLLISIPRSRRPRQSWSISKCLHVYMLRVLIDLPVILNLNRKRDPNLAVPDSQLKNAKFVWVAGVDEDSLEGEIRDYAKKAGVKPARIPGYWQFKEGTTTSEIYKARPHERVLYHLHGGALHLGTAHPSDPTARIPRAILKHSDTITRSFAVDYRLCASAPFTAENPFPAALLDCIAGYQYLIHLGFQPENITLMGDSAGGNLALALMRYLTINTIPGLSPPKKFLLLSPWADLSTSRTTSTSSYVANRMTDIFPTTRPRKNGFANYGIMSYLGSALDLAETKTNKFISPASPHLTETSGMFKGFPKTYVLGGGAERILDDAIVIAERIRADNGADGWVTLDVPQDAVHDFIIFPWMEPERSEALGRIRKWMDEV